MNIKLPSIQQKLKQSLFFIALFIGLSFQIKAQLTTTLTYSGAMQTYTVPAGVNLIRIEVRGASGGNPAGSIIPAGLGARMIGDFTVTPGQLLKVLIGQSPTIANNGGGGTFVTDMSNNPKIIAGGGGGAASAIDSPNKDGQTSTSGASGASGGGTGGTSGNGGNSGASFSAGAGGGLLTNGTDGDLINTGGISFMNGGTSLPNGGFGGGGSGSGTGTGGGGGGYSGGGAGSNSLGGGVGGGGGSYNSGTNQSNTAGFNTGNGLAIFTVLSSLNIVKTGTISCYGQAAGTLTASIVGGDAPYTYTWSPTGGNTAIASGLAAGVYSLTVKDALNVITKATYTLTQPAALSATTSQTNILCNGGATGVGRVVVSGGTAPYTYSWSPIGGTTAISSAILTAGVYTCTIKDSKLCTFTKTLTITQPSLAITATTSQTNVSCFGLSNGQASVTASGGTGSTYTYSWSPSGGTSSLATGLSASAYSCIIKDVNSCSITKTFALTQPPNFTVSAAASNTTVCFGNNIVLNGNGSDIYSWTGGVSNGISFMPSSSATYTVTGTNTLTGCSKTASISINVNPLPIINVNSGAICLGKTFTIIPTGATTYTYSNGTNVVAPTSNSNYTITGTDINGCSNTTGAICSVTVNGLPNISVNSGAICAGNSFTIIPSGALTYTYSGGSNIVSPSSTTNYSVNGTDVNGCKSSTSAISSITVNALPNISVNSGTICPGNSFTMTPSGALTYTYSSGSDVVSPTISTNYSITGTDANGCTNLISAISSVTVSAPPNIIVNSGTICPGNSFTITPTGALTYTYSSGSDIVSPTTTTDYTVTGTDANGCVNLIGAISSVTVNAPPNITVNSGTVCLGNPFTITPSGASTYTYSSGSNIVYPTSATDYTVTGTDANGCVNLIGAISSVSINPSTIIVNSTTICPGKTATLTASGASTYTWSTNQTSASITVSPNTSTQYTVLGINASSCLDVAIAAVTVDALPTISVNSQTICNGQTAILTASGSITYTWSSGQNTSSISVSPTAPVTQYTVTTGNANNCVNSAIARVVTNPLPNVFVNSRTICAGKTATLTANSFGNPSFLWSTGQTTQMITVSPTTTTQYSVTVTNANNCSRTATANVNVNPLPIVTLNTSAINLQCVSINSVTLIGGSPAGGVYSGVAVTGGDFSPALAGVGNYTITYSYTNANNCTNTASDTITVDACNGIKSIEASIFSIYPNPSNGLVIIKSTLYPSIINVFDVTGKLITSKVIDSSETELNVSDIANGIYQLNIITDKGSYYHKLVIKK